MEYAHSHGLALVALYIHEPQAVVCPHSHGRHFKFIADCLQDLSPQLSHFRIRTVIAEADAVEVFSELVSLGLKSVFSHEETGLLWTYTRDNSLQKVFKSGEITWHQAPTNGVVRRLASRDHWKSIYDDRMSQREISQPKNILSSHNLITLDAAGLSYGKFNWQPWGRSDLILTSDWNKQQQSGGEGMALATLKGFHGESLLKNRYLSSLSNPIRAAQFGSRLSPYLAFGCISSKQVLAFLKNTQISSKDVSAFRSRLAWRCHFIQKLEDFPSLEQIEVNAQYKDLRPEMSSEDFDRWHNGMTGVPFVDACLRSVHTTGFLNFRMRAMLMSFATHALWRDWRRPACDLAQAFLDFEPGIHYAQVQMQAAVTGNNAIRVYSPLKQGLENDPKALFIKKWVHELKDSEAQQIHSLQNLPNNYPKPMIDLSASLAYAKQILYAKIKDPEVRNSAKFVQEKLGSRSIPVKFNRKKPQKPSQKETKIKETLALHVGTLFDDPSDD
jgi:deoxyribodipyrimidine photo-lyase